MTVTAVYTDKSEYSRYHTHLSVITATIEVSNPTPGNVITASLFRLDGYGTVVSKQVTLTAATSYTVTFDLNKDSYVQVSDGGAISNPSIYMCKAGDYTVNVADSSVDIVSSAMFAVSIVPVWAIKQIWARGIDFLSQDILMPRIQPQTVTGVTIQEVSSNHFKGVFNLSYTQGTPCTLSWGGGQLVSIVGQGNIQLMLLNPTDDFVIVQVNTFQLPSSSVSENLYIDNQRITDEAIQSQVRLATAWVEQQIVCKIEPQIVDTDNGVNGLYADETAIAETFYRPKNTSKWMSFKIPYPQILDLSVTGYFNTTKSVIVPRQWLLWDQMTGMCELVPSTNSTVIWAMYNSVFVMSYLYGFSSIPGFWHYRAYAGLRDLFDHRSICIEAIAKKTCIELLLSQGSSYKGGYASESVSRDGISSSSSFTSSASFGLYSGHYESYKTWLQDNIKRMRTRFSGINYVTI